MNTAERVAKRLTVLLPSRDRARYEEQWAADLRDVDELELCRRQLLWAAGRTVVSLQLRDLRVRGLYSPLPWLALSVVAVAACLYGAASIALNTSDGMTSGFLGLVGLLLALVALHRLNRRIGARATLVGGSLLTAEGFAVAWLGHMGSIEVTAGAALLILGLATTIRARSRRPRRVASLTLLTVGATLVLASLLGIGGQYLDCRLNAGGFDCLEGFAGDPSSYPTAPSTATDIRTGFSWNPLGRTCSWGPDAPAALNGTTTTAATNFQGDQNTSDWIYRFGTLGVITLALGSLVRLPRRTHSTPRK